LDRLEQTTKAARQQQKAARIHLDLETGMNRIGLGQNELERVAEHISNNSHLLQVAGACTHFAGAESSENHDRVIAQLNRYNVAVRSLQSMGLKIEKLHTACSAAVMAYPETHF